MTKNEEFRRENDSLRIEIDAGREKNIELLKVVEEIGESYTQIQDELNTPSAEEPQQWTNQDQVLNLILRPWAFFSMNDHHTPFSKNSRLNAKTYLAFRF